MKQIAASILGKDNKKDLINKLITEGIGYIHYDVMDGDFVSNTSLPLDEVEFLFENTNKHYKDVHLMVQEPMSYVNRLIGKADQISVHVESNIKETLKGLVDIASTKTKLGLVINPDTNVEEVFPYLEKLNHVMIMSVVPGKGGQTFIESSLDKITKLKNEIKNRNLNTIIEIDGGINDQWGPVVFDKGVNLAVSGSYLINNLENGSINKIYGNK